MKKIVFLQFGREFIKKRIDFPILLEIPKEKENEFESVEIPSYRDLFRRLLYLGEKGQKEFDEIFDNPN